REHDHLRALRQVVELLAQHLELLGPHLRPPLVDLGVGVARRVDDRGRRARFPLDAHEVVEDRLAREALDDPHSRLAAGEPGRDDGPAHQLERPRDVQSLTACERQAGARPVTLAALEVRHRDRPREGGVESDGHYHVKRPPRSFTVRVAYHLTRPARPGFATEREATSGRRPTSFFPSQISTRPSGSPSWTGSFASRAGTTRCVSVRPGGAGERRREAATSGSCPRPYGSSTSA